MRRNALQQVGDRLGWLAYLTVMGRGAPDLNMVFLPWPDVEQEPPEEAERAVQPRNPFMGSIPREPEPERKPEGAAAA